jgi:regulator of protease activity HflC (stomatin/prohibitin superfamily)
MTPFIQLITEAVRFLFDAIPRVEIICADEMAVRFMFGKRVQVLSPGVYVYVPLISKIEKATVTLRSLGMKKQSLSSKDGQSLMIEAACFYEIRDIKKAIVENHDIRDIIEDIVMSEIRTKVVSVSFSELQGSVKQIEEDVCRYSREYLKSKGVIVSTVRLLDIAKCIHLNNIKNITYSKSIID